MAEGKYKSRRDFLQKAALISGGIACGIQGQLLGNTTTKTMTNKLTIEKADSAFEREPLQHAYGFKGGYITRLWQVISRLQDDRSTAAIGLGIQSPLWSDATVTSRWGESGSNAIMYAMTNRALQMIAGQKFDSPVAMIDPLLNDLHAYGKQISGNNALRKTFALNALVSLDNAAWLLYARQNNLTSFDQMIPDEYRSALGYKHQKVASVPSISYGTPVAQIENLTKEGYFFIKIKIGAPGDQRQMVEADMERMTLIHEKMKNVRTPHSESGKVYYYLDANGRYETKERFKQLLAHCEKIGALSQVVVVEEPFPESFAKDVSDIPVRIAADESAHTDEDARQRMEQGYTAIALKPIAKTLSMTLKIARLAKERNVPCLCADLTVNPVLVDWNKSVAARLAPLPGLQVGLLETNGHQNYKNWDKMIGYHPRGKASWNQNKNGVFELSEEFYNKSAGIFEPLPHYSSHFEY